MEWGVQVHRAVSSAEVQLLLRAGVKRATVPLSWGWAERERGVWNFASVDYFLAPLRDAGVPLQGVLGPGISERWPPWVEAAGGADSDEYIDWFSQYCSVMAEACSDIEVFRVEEDLNSAFWWDGLRTRRRTGRVWRDPGFRRRLLRSACDAIVDVRPDAQLRVTVRPGVPGWKRDLARLGRAGLPIARVGLSLPASSLLADPELGDEVGSWITEAREILCSSGGTGLELEVARCGYPTHRTRYSPRDQRHFLARAAASAVTAGSVGFHWWALRDQANDDPKLGYWTPESERHMGLLYYDSTPKPAIDEFRVLATGDRFGEGC